MKGPTGKTQTWVGNPPHDSPELPTPWLSNQANHWMNGRTSNSGDSIGGRLRTDDADVLEQYGRYLAAWVVGFERAHDVPLYVISLQNESTFESPFDSATFTETADGGRDYTQYAAALKAVKDAWQRYNLSTKIMGPHVAGIGPTPQNPFTLSPQLGMIEAVRKHADKDLLGFLDFYNSNYYMPAGEAGALATAGYLKGSAAVPGEWGKNWGFTYSFDGVARDGKPIWFSETGDPPAPWRNDQGGGVVELPAKIMNALIHGNAVAYVYWMMSDGDDELSGSNLIGTKHLDDPASSKKYAAMCQFSRFIPPSSRRIEASFGNGESTVGGKSVYDTTAGLTVVAFDTDDGIVIVLLNLTTIDQTVTLPPGRVTEAWLTDVDRSLAAVDVAGDAVVLPRASVVTVKLHSPR